MKVSAAGGNGGGDTKSPTSTHTSPTSTHTSPTSTHTTPSSTTTTHVSPTSTHTTGSSTPTGKPTVLGVKLTAGASPKSLAFTGASVGPALLVAGLLVGAGVLLLIGVQLPTQQRRH